MSNEPNRPSGDINADVGVEAQNVVIGNNNNQTLNNYIIVVARFLEFAQVEGLLPRLNETRDFNDLSKAIEKTFGTESGDDLTEATAFAGEIIGDVLREWTLKYSHRPLPLGQLIAPLAATIHQKLKITQHWEAHSQSTEDGWTRILWLEATTKLWKNKFGPKDLFIRFGIGEPYPLTKHPVVWIAKRYKYVAKGDSTIFGGIDPDEWNTQQHRVFIAGVLLDLIRIASDASFNKNFVQEIITMVTSKEKK